MPDSIRAATVREHIRKAVQLAERAEHWRDKDGDFNTVERVGYGQTDAQLAGVYAELAVAAGTEALSSRVVEILRSRSDQALKLLMDGALPADVAAALRGELDG